MVRSPLCVSPVAECLVAVAERRGNGTLQLGRRKFELRDGALVDVTVITPGPNDCEIGEFLVRSGRLTPEQHSAAQARAVQLGAALITELSDGALISDSDLRTQLRTLWLDMLTRALRVLAMQPLDPDAWVEAADATETTYPLRVRLIPLLLDALSRVALPSDAHEIAQCLEHRLVWREGAAGAEATLWASFGQVPERPLVAGLLAKLPACAPQISALVRAGVATLQLPPSSTQPSQLPLPTLGPPPSRLSNIPLQFASLPPHVATDPQTRIRKHADPDGARLRPGGDGNPIEEIPKVSLPRWPNTHAAPLSDPLRDPELELQDCDIPAQRARLLVRLGELWGDRIGSPEEAARHLRQAAAEAPTDPSIQLQCARACLETGHGDLAQQYASAALDAATDPSLRAGIQRLLAGLHSRLDQPDAARTLLQLAADEHAAASWPHQLLAALDYEGDALASAAQHMSRAADIERGAHPQRALALYALAYGWEPDNTRTATDYADLLVEQQHAGAAVAVLTQTARTLEGGARTALFCEAAARAQQHYRHSVAAELWASVIGSEAAPEHALEALYECLPRAGSAAHRAALLESLLHAVAQRGETHALSRLLESTSEVLRELAAAAPDTAAAAASIAEHYAALAAQPAGLDGLVAQAEQQTTPLRESAAATDAASVTQRLSRLAAARAQLGDWDAVASTCLQALTLTPADVLASARLYCAARSGITHPTVRAKAFDMLTRTHEESARAWLMLGEDLEQAGDSGGALAAAQSALQHDPHAADAALLALRHLQSAPPELALPIAEQAGDLLAGPPAVLFAIAELARSTGKPELRRSALHAAIDLLPDFALPRLVLLESDLEEADASLTEADARDLVRHAVVAPVDGPLRRAVHALAERGEYASAARVAELWLANSARLDPELASYALELAQSSGERSLQIKLLERMASTHGADADRVRCLLQLAMRHKQAGDRVAELRALLRAAALPDARPRALQQLSMRFAEMADLPRLLMVLSQRLSLASSQQERRKLLLEMASASVHFARDHSRASSYMRSYVRACEGDSRALLAALGALFALGEPSWAYEVGRELALEQPEEIGAAMLLWLAHRAQASPLTAEAALTLAALGAKTFPCCPELLLMAERLALLQYNKPAVMEVYASLIHGAWGMHGQRALYYRAGRWLERLGEPRDALEQYEHAFDICCSQGVVYAALERCARETQQPERLLSALHKLIHQPASERQRVQLYNEAVDVCVEECDDPGKALILLYEAEPLVPLGALDDRTLAIVERLDHTDDDSAITLHELVRLRAERVEQLWEAESKAEALLKLAALQEHACHDPAAAARTLQPLIEGGLATELSDAKREQANDQYMRLTSRVA